MAGTLLAVMLAIPVATHAQFTGQVLGVQDCSGVTAFGCSGNWNTTPTGAGVESTPLLPTPPFPGIFLDVSDTRIVVGLEPGTAAVAFGPPFALRFFDVNNSIAPFLSATLSGTGLLSDPSRLTFDSNEIMLNFQGVTLEASPSGQQIIAQIDVTFAAQTVVPEPTSAVLLGTGLLGLCGLAVRNERRHRASSTTD